MASDSPTPRLPSVRPRIRILVGAEIALGPGKGSLPEAARSLEISYMRAWHLLQTINACFKEPLVHSSRGGSKHGGASPTETGRAVVAAYRRMEAESLRAMDPAWQEILPLLAE